MAVEAHGAEEDRTMTTEQLGQAVEAGEVAERNAEIERDIGACAELYGISREEAEKQLRARWASAETGVIRDR